MAERAHPDPRGSVCGRPGCLFLAEPLLGIVKLRAVDGEAAHALALAIGITLPPHGVASVADGIRTLWLGPREWLMTLTPSDVNTILTRAAPAIRGGRAMAIDATHGFCAWRVEGHQAAQTIADHCPLDLRSAQFGENSVARSLFGDVRVIIDRLPDHEHTACFRLIVAAPLGRYVAERASSADLQALPMAETPLDSEL